MAPNPTSTLQIPAEAMPVVRVLRRDISRPDPEKLLGPTYCRWGNKCPMGLHPDSLHVTPASAQSFLGDGRCDTDDVWSFAYWWDHLDLPEAKQAVDLIWPVGGSDAS